MEASDSVELLRESFRPGKRRRSSTPRESRGEARGTPHSQDIQPFSLRLTATGECIPFGVEGVRIGRDPTCCNLVPSSSNCSRLHCILSVIGGEVCIHDKSSNGTYVNGRSVGRGRCALLKNCDVVSLVNPKLPEVGEFSYVFEMHTSKGDAAVWPAALAEGMRRYELGPSLGQGSFAVVRLGLDRETGDRVAIKILEKKKFFSELAFTSLHTEVEILRSMDHPNIVKVLDAFEAPNTVALVMEYVKGGDLFDYIVGRGRNPFTEEETRFLFLQLLEALLYIHRRKIVHCDLKPENVLVNVKTGGCTPPPAAGDDNALLSVADNHQSAARSLSPFCVELKLTDFGIAKYRGEAEMSDDAELSIGTPSYAAPELLRLAQQEEPLPSGEVSCVSSAVDIWSLGVLLHVLRTGCLPKRTSDSRVVQFSKHMDGASTNFKSLLQQMLAYSPDDRISLNDLCTHPWLEGAEVQGWVPVEEDDMLSVTATLSPRFGRSMRPSSIL